MQRSCSEDEQVLALVAVSRFRLPVGVLAVTQDRLATFWLAEEGYRMVDEVFLHALTELSVAHGFLRAGGVRARCGHATQQLGTLVGMPEAEQVLTAAVAQARADREDRDLARLRSGEPRVNPELLRLVVAEEGAQAAEGDGPQPGDGEGAGGAGAPELVRQLAELSRLHREGELSAEEFAAAKRRVLG